MWMDIYDKIIPTYEYVVASIIKIVFFILINLEEFIKFLSNTCKFTKWFRVQNCYDFFVKNPMKCSHEYSQ